MNGAPAVRGFAFAIAVSCGIEVADALGPPLNETLKWLSETINTRATNGGGGRCPGGGAFAGPCSWRYETVPLASCEVSLVLTQTNNSPAGPASAFTEELTMPLWEDFSPAPFTLPGEGETWRVILLLRDATSQTMPLKKTFRSRTATSVEFTTRSFGEIQFGVPGGDNKDTAERVAKAFSRAIQLCQGRKPKNKQPF